MEVETNLKIVVNSNNNDGIECDSMDKKTLLFIHIGLEKT